ncbi:quinone oxidoreductase family protein [Aureivirga marina]|uniref:quinone oxidoreductase family protein n=1 Tax=Aureivirga marina TaxID=1182451 RepID=UPI0018CA7D28|nr:quinone oxidoreductase [Aureivirga marina]
MKALTFSKFGNPEVLKYKEIAKPNLIENSVLVKTKAIGLNYADIYRRKGNYHLKGNPPFIVGYEGAGIIEESNCNKYKIGDRIAFVDVPFSNAEYVLVPEEHIIPLPDYISFELASSVLLQGLTADYLVNDSYNVSENDIVLIHAASGGVGQFLTQLCKNKNAIVFGLTRNETKLKTILDSGADKAILLNAHWKSSVLELTKGNGVSVVYDSVGKTLQDSFEITQEKGTVVFYGMSGGDPEFVNPRMLMDTSKTLVGGDLWSYLKTGEERRKRANELFKMLYEKKVQIKEPTKFKLSEGKLAHEYLESGKSSNKILLIP